MPSADREGSSYVQYFTAVQNESHNELPDNISEVNSEEYWDDPFSSYHEPESDYKKFDTGPPPAVKLKCKTQPHRTHRPRRKREGETDTDDMISSSEAHLSTVQLSAGEAEREKVASRIAKEVGVERIDGMPQWEPERNEEMFKSQLRQTVIDSCDNDLLPSHKDQLASVVCGFSMMFSYNKEKLGCYFYSEVDIETTDSIPVFAHDTNFLGQNGHASTRLLICWSEQVSVRKVCRHGVVLL